jgi:uncharacterized membrane protein
MIPGPVDHTGPRLAMSPSMTPFPILDLVAIAGFVTAWAGYVAVLELSARGEDSLDARMHRFRAVWMRRASERDTMARLADSRIVASLQSGTGFFASASLLVIGAALTFLHSTDDLRMVIGDLPLGVHVTRGQLEVKIIGLLVILVYAFFKFAWTYRLFNYVAILLGSMPPAAEAGTPEAEVHVQRATRLSESAGHHFNRGQRAIFFSLGYLGWFAGPYALMAATVATVIVMWRRQFVSESRRALVE